MIKKSEKQKMIDGELYNARNPKLVLERDYTASVLQKYNSSTFHEINMQHKLMKKLLHTNGNFWIKPPFHCDYGYNITIGKEVMLNYGCTLLDVCPIVIEDYVLIGPSTQIYTACHPIDPEQRKAGIEFGKPVTIKKNVWIGGNSVILPGVIIGENSVIGAGSVVTKSIPDNVIAVGNPCKVIKSVYESENSKPSE